MIVFELITILLPWTKGRVSSMGIHRMPPVKDSYINYRVQYDNAAVQRCNIQFAGSVAHVA